jgi:receptor protein-tyrosine kinase
MSTIERALGKEKPIVEKNKIIVETSLNEQHTEQAKLNKEYLDQKTEINIAHDKIINSKKATIATAINRDKSNKTTQSAGCSVCIDINLEHLHDQGILIPSNERSNLNEEYRRIKQPLINNIKGKSAQVIERANLLQITSSLPGEGKTFTAVNLAIAISQELDYNVLLVDADLLRSSINQVLGIEAKRGLSEYLSADIEHLADVLLTTNIPKLTLLPAGKQHHLTSELFSSSLMDNLFEELSERYSDRIIIIDSPPVLSTNEANILSRKVGQIVFVIEQNKTTQANVKEALSQFDKSSIIGIVMNKSRTNNSGGYYGYYY